MKREYPEQPLIGVGAIIIQDFHVALIKRAHPPLVGEWSIPGGVLEVGETLRQAAVREAWEETGLRVLPLDLLGVFDRVIRDDAHKVQYHYVLIDFYCQCTGGQLSAAGDAAESRWFTLPEALKLPLPAETSEVIQLGFSKAGKSSEK